MDFNLFFLLLQVKAVVVVAVQAQAVDSLADRAAVEVVQRL